ncbi:tripartite tricarboxylate transporter TctB family protein [Acuticoccus mangrovi]|uniref:Tripartite tricarboxylate transporter TctB family protein n=1 Tax=Acuticoccus mangrovi TaxID=2796142 RepID=A0A934MD08_9HYPH|nr:tripartite tricarboxylate transporter TctB family protein [Acuticoccus mangrovi]MBJ3775827.1 tripartite tricarboxylate transporter TctB family protein [Acuticoccus mangrovi]
MSGARRADLVFAVLLTVFGIAATVESWRMPTLAELGVDPMSAPGLTPGLLGVVLAVLGLALLGRSLGGGEMGETAAAGGWGRLAVALVLCLGYAAGLLGRVPFWAATAIFVALFTFVFTVREAGPVRAGAGSLVLAAAVAVAVTLLFERVFLVRLP